MRMHRPLAFVYWPAMALAIEESWKEALTDEFGKDYFKALGAFVKSEYQEGIVYPAPKAIFRAFELTPFDKVKVVILGQDPYHGKGQANGLSFAVSGGVRNPPSLQNIFKEIETEFGQPVRNQDGDLSRWAKQGVLLLNATLTVRAAAPGSHQGKGWEEFTTAAVRALSEKREHLVFMLWGKYAREKGAIVDGSKHLVLESPHPSPYSASSGFFGNGHFKKANDYLARHNQTPIDWLS